MTGLPLFKTATVTAASAAKVGETGQRRLMAFLLFGGTADSQVEFKNAATDTGTVLLTAAALLDTSIFVDLTRFGGLLFDTAMFCKPAGTGAICYIWYQ
ncbi:hypothetical protein LCGC14_2213740 [marine sediment metagenome]|uniref:Uncharacterized protein n=1 Tax=marine sediment metagenome TaxID=412755 RepID=A0A0F9DD54_9ZZZZ